MSPVQPWGWIGAGAGLALAAGGLAAGVTAERVVKRRREEAAAAFSPEELAALGTVTGHTYELHTDDGVRLHVEVDELDDRDSEAQDSSAGDDAEDEGRAEPPLTVVLVHGYGLSLQSWHFQRLALRQQYRVVSYDQRGHGRSQPGPPGSARIARLAADLRQVLDAHAPEGPLVIVGHSMGGMTVMGFAEQNHEYVHSRVLGVALVATSAGDLARLSFGLPGGQAVTRVAPNVLAVLARRPDLVSRGRRMVSEVEALVVRRWSFASAVPPELARFTAGIIAATSVEVVSDYLPGFSQHDQRDALKVLNDVETLVLVGDSDLMTPPAHSEVIIRALPDAEHVVVRRAGHLVMLEHPTIVNRYLLDLLERAEKSQPRRLGQEVDR